MKQRGRGVRWGGGGGGVCVCVCGGGGGTLNLLHRANPAQRSRVSSGTQ